MKYKLIIIILLSIFMTGCIPVVSDKIDVSATAESTANTEMEQETVQSTAQLSNEIEQLKVQNKQLGAELDDYKSLISQLNSLLKNVYYIEGKNRAGGISYGTAFSIEYNNKYYLITAGHIIENKHGKFNNFKFKANFSDEWIYPELLSYENGISRKVDYAILFSDKINGGLIIDKDNDNPKYILGNKYKGLNLIKNTTSELTHGDSGSPIIDEDGEVTGIIVKDNSINGRLDIILQAIDNIK